MHQKQLRTMKNLVFMLYLVVTCVYVADAAITGGLWYDDYGKFMKFVYTYFVS